MSRNNSFSFTDMAAANLSPGETTANDDPFVNSHSHGHPSPHRYASFDNSNTSTVIEGDTNGDGIADFVIRVDGNFNFNAADFLL